MDLAMFQNHMGAVGSFDISVSIVLYLKYHCIPAILWFVGLYLDEIVVNYV